MLQKMRKTSLKEASPFKLYHVFLREVRGFKEFTEAGLNKSSLKLKKKNDDYFKTSIQPARALNLRFFVGHFYRFIGYY